VKRDFIAIHQWDRKEILENLAVARDLKARSRRGERFGYLEGRMMALVFQKPSLRTRISFEAAMRSLGGQSLFISPDEIKIGEREPVADVARVLSGYADIIAARVFAHDIVTGLAEHASVPVVNALSDYNHPCQIFCDLLTILEKKGSVENFRITYIGDGNNVVHSWLNACSRLAFHLTLAIPEGYDPDPKTLESAKQSTGGSIRLLRDPIEAARGADVLYTDTWVSMGQEKEAEKKIRDFRGFRIDAEVVKAAGPDVIVMHCLPAYRGKEITDDVMEGPNSVVFEQAENRLHGQRAVILDTMGVRADAR
jgi:ornithine carbamoyltransferase